MSEGRKLPALIERRRVWLERQRARSADIMDDLLFSQRQREHERRRYEAADRQILALQEYIEGKRGFVLLDGILR